MLPDTGGGKHLADWPAVQNEVFTCPDGARVPITGAVGARRHPCDNVRPRMSKNRLYGALACYGGLGLVALAVLVGPFLIIVLIFLGVLAIKSWIAFEKER